MEAMILKTCNLFNQEDTKEMENHRKKSDKISHEYLIAENVITNKPSGLQMSN
jgi:hypothetical protein